MQPQSLNATIGRNIQLLREQKGLSRLALAEYLKVDSSQITSFENGAISIPTVVISAIADLFCVEESDLYEQEIASARINIAFAFKANSISTEDLTKIAGFKKIVKNYMKMNKALSYV